MKILFVFNIFMLVIVYTKTEKTIDLDAIFPKKDTNGGFSARLSFLATIVSVLQNDDLIFHFFSKANPDAGVAINSNTVDAISKIFDPKKGIIVLFHGWNNTITSPFPTTMRKAVLKNLDVNLFVVDWSATAARHFLNAFLHTVGIGNDVGEFIRALVRTYNISSLDNVTFVGHSMGAHVAGMAGQALRGQVPVIVALDPAQPIVVFVSPSYRLDKTDAKFVQVIHTNGGFLGIMYNVGHADYYPNGGSAQPGCDDPACDHDRAFEYYAESLGSNKFVAKKCPSYRNFLKGNCKGKGSPSSIMGTYNIDTSARGSYYLETNSKSPFAIGR